MENKIVFRNHISSIFENVFRTTWIFLVSCVGSFIAGIGEMSAERMVEELLVLLVVTAVPVGAVAVWKWLVWSKTYIEVQEHTVVMECNTLHRKKNTIAISTISNINLERNLFQMVLGTAKVKIDTNSLSMAEKTDLQLVLKVEDAERFRELLTSRLAGETEVTEPVDSVEEKKTSVEHQVQYKASTWTIICHGLFSGNLIVLSVLVLGVILGVIGAFSEMRGLSVKVVMEGLSTLALLFLAVFGLIWRAAKGFVKYMDFELTRREDKLWIQYGVLKSVSYAIPIDKINAICLRQSSLARLCNQYMVEVINVGMGDDEEEQDSFLLPYDKAEAIRGQLEALLPEFQGCMDMQVERQPRCIWKVWVLPVILYLLVVSGVVAVVAEVFGLFWSGAIVAGVLSVILLILKILRYQNEGIAFGERIMKVTSGGVAREELLVRYERIQYLSFKQHFLAKRYGVCRGDIHLLASLAKTTHLLPYMKQEKMEELKERVLGCSR